MSNGKEPSESYLGRASFVYENTKEPGKNVRVLMCDHEVEGNIKSGYFVISKPGKPEDYKNMGSEKIGKKEVMVFIPEQCLERMACHLDIVRRKRNELQQKEAAIKRTNRTHSNLRT